MSAVLVLGGTGLIGGAVTRALRDAGHAVTVLSRRAATLPGVESLVADRSEADALAAVLGGRRFDLTVDLLAYTAEDVERLAALPMVPGRLVMISTGQVYLVAAERSPPFVEADSARPAMPEPTPDTRDHANWVYGMGKRAAEAAAARCFADATVVRLPVVQGAQDGTRRLWAYVQRLLDGGPVLLPDAHTPVRHVWNEDVGRLMVRFAEGARGPSSVYNLAMPDEPTLEAFIRRVAAHLGVTPRLVPCDPAAMVAAGVDLWCSPYSGAWCSRPDPSRVQAELGFVPTPSEGWLGPVIAGHLSEAEPAPHFSYEQRAAEIAFAGG